MENKGLIQIYTGNGKGKTTAAVGLSIRAISHGLNVCYIFFHKDPDSWEYGELRILKELGVEVYGFAKKHPYFSGVINEGEIRKECLKALDFIKEISRQNKYDVLILDEINISLRDGFLKEEEVIEILNSKPEKLEIVLTGRGCPEKLIEKADLVSEIKKIKHPFDKGLLGRKGIEY